MVEQAATRTATTSEPVARNERSLTALGIAEKQLSIPRSGYRTVQAEVAAYMADVTKGHTDETLTVQFGISANTWTKIRRGLPVRCSLADRLEARIQQMRAG